MILLSFLFLEILLFIGLRSFLIASKSDCSYPDGCLIIDGLRAFEFQSLIYNIYFVLALFFSYGKIPLSKVLKYTIYFSILASLLYLVFFVAF